MPARRLQDLEEELHYAAIRATGLENFGITAAGLREEFADYRAEYGFH